MRKSGELADHALEAEERPAAGVRLVAVDQRAPLRRRHRAGSGVGEQIDQDVLRRELEDVVARPPERAIRSPRVVTFQVSTDLMRNGSMIV
jgi:hypothetical protein